MNIALRTSSGRIVFRPDTTWERANADVYLPEFVDKVSWSPVVFARLSRAGRSVGRRFASRYYESAGFGVLLYPEDMIDGSPEGYAEASCIDHTSFLPDVLFRPEELDSGDLFTITKDGKEIYSAPSIGRAALEDAIPPVTERLYIRTGDLLAVELAPRAFLTSREEGNAVLRGYFGKTLVLDFKVIVR